jgi:GNAT superfamily N-acetyltransferase
MIELAPVTTGLVIRRPETGDRSALEEMLSRCSLESRYGRFLGPVRAFPADHLAAVTAVRPDVDAWMPVIAYGGEVERVVGLASLHAELDDLGSSGSVGVLVEDAWQRQGLGSRLLAGLADRARQRGMRQLRAHILADHTYVLRTLQRVVGRGSVHYASGLAEVTITL